MSDLSIAPVASERTVLPGDDQPARKRKARREPLTPAEVRQRIRDGLNVKVPDFAPVYGDTRSALYRQIREKRVEAVRSGRTLYLTARVAGPLIGIEPIAA